jgi:ketosteroid isomerase-like protein
MMVMEATRKTIVGGKTMRNRQDGNRPPNLSWLVAACIGLSVLACGGPPEQAPVEPEPAPEDVAAARRDAVIGAHEALTAAYQAADADAFAAQLDSSPELTIFHPVMQNRFNDVEELKTHLAAMFERMGEIDWTDAHPVVAVEGDVAWVTSNVLIQSPNLERAFVGRGTEIWVLRGESWKLIHGHWSENPEIRPESRVKPGV